MSVTEVHDVDGLPCFEDLIVEVIPAPAEKETANIAEELARRATSRLGYVLDQRQARSTSFASKPRDAGRLRLHHSSAASICATAIGATVTV